MKVDRFYKLRLVLQAFSLKVIQGTGVMLEWASSNGFALEEVLEFSKLVPRVMELEQLGYFMPAPSPEHAKAIRDYERKLPREFRRELRKARLESSFAGHLHR